MSPVDQFRQAVKQVELANQKREIACLLEFDKEFHQLMPLAGRLGLSTRQMRECLSESRF
jgi:hypothetical protein